MDRNNPQIQSLNKFLKEQLPTEIKWIELSNAFYDDFGNLNSAFTHDGLHFTEQAYLQLEKELNAIL